jgi:hypothetical protein
MEKPRVPRFRIVLEATFPQADPMDPSNYGNVINRWKETLGSDEVSPCQDVQIREFLTVGDIDDYDDWRDHKGEYDYTKESERFLRVRTKDDGRS